ncbi:RsmB/NOP family class I SAM-dependent RNA methyltransferase [Sphingomonas sp.]|uniref:RsmB/NOP family class I SAM-dependent RNA methyltransferase n=1 Tax=Sphingomonas sp. TaxID=28214 RepID=UPI00286DEE82|nr:RsmB/NOP family class I SAM-dependent RNA methyltransferase [Sphingomonas sp.]
MKHADPEGVEPRRVALRILDRVLRSGQTVDTAAQGSAPAEQALTLAIVGETLRRLPEIDALIDSATRNILPGDAKARMVLRLALAQKLAMNVPDHALVATALPLIEGGPRRLVHGVLGTLLRRGIAPADSTPLPADVEQRWASAWGDDVVEAARRGIVRRPPLDLTFADAGEAIEYASKNGGASLAPRHVRLPESGSVANLTGFGEGRWWVQDVAASLPARLIPAEAANVLDVCAAPGGKTMQLAAAGHRVTSLDRSQSRLARLSQNLARTHLQAKLIKADALAWDAPEPFDAILLDAPCSATGTFRRHPEVLYRARPAFIREQAEQQSQLLARTSTWLKPGGALVYAVCSLEPEEGEGVITQFLAAHPAFTLSPPTDLPAGLAAAPDGWLRILPGMLEQQGGLDGFFVARLVRSGG